MACPLGGSQSISDRRGVMASCCCGIEITIEGSESNTGVPLETIAGL